MPITAQEHGDKSRSVSSRVLSVLAAFTPQTPELRLTEIALAIGMPVSTAHRLIGELTEWGALDRMPDGRYRIGLRLWELGGLCPQPRTLRDVALPMMQDLYKATSENVQLAVLDGGEALYIERVFGRQSVNVASRVGGRLPLHATGVGKVLLSYAPAEVRDGVMRSQLPRYTRHTQVMPGVLARALADIRATGVARCAEEMTLGTVSIAAPIFDGHNRVVAALSVVMHTRARTYASIEPAIKLAAMSISRELAGRYTLDLA